MPENTNELGTQKTVLILATVAGCFALLWPQIFYPMLTSSMTRAPTPESSGCCDFLFESDISTADIIQELCRNIAKHHQVDPLLKEALIKNKLDKTDLCKKEVFDRCGINLSKFLAEEGRLGKSYKQVLEEIRTFNGSLCLKLQFGVPFSQLGTPRLIRNHILMPHSTLKQERQTPPHAGSFHPALRERGRAIPSSHVVPRVESRPNHVNIKMRPPMGGAGHVVPAPKGNGFMGIIMPLYTIGIIIFFIYTITKVLRKSNENEYIPEYPRNMAESEFQKMVFNPEVFQSAINTLNGNAYGNKCKSSALSEEPPTIQELKEQIEDVNRSSNEGFKTAIQDDLTGDTTDKEQRCFESSTVQVVNMEMTASCEGGQKCSRPTTPILITPHSHQEKEKSPAPVPIYLEGSLPSQCELLVTDSKTQQIEEKENMEAPVVLSGKMTLSLISLEQVAAELENNCPKITSKLKSKSQEDGNKIIGEENRLKTLNHHPNHSNENQSTINTSNNNEEENNDKPVSYEKSNREDDTEYLNDENESEDTNDSEKNYGEEKEDNEENNCIQINENYHSVNQNFNISEDENYDSDDIYTDDIDNCNSYLSSCIKNQINSNLYTSDLSLNEDQIDKYSAGLNENSNNHSNDDLNESEDSNDEFDDNSESNKDSDQDYNEEEEDDENDNEDENEEENSEIEDETDEDNDNDDIEEDEDSDRDDDEDEDEDDNNEDSDDIDDDNNDFNNYQKNYDNAKIKTTKNFVDLDDSDEEDSSDQSEEDQ